MRLRIQGEEHDVDPGRLTYGEATRIEMATGMTFGKWAQRLQEGSIVALQALVWVLMRRSRPELRFDDIADMALEDVEMLADPEEVGPGPKPKRGRVALDPTQKASE